MNLIPDYLLPERDIIIGSYTFEAGDIIRFAAKFDPQIFHLDALEAKKSIFGALCASGWHTAAIWMKLQRAHVAKHSARLEQAGKPVPEFGPSPGFSDLKWMRPVYVGDTITYKNRYDTPRKSKSRPGWWVFSGVFTGENQDARPVISFNSTVLIRLDGNSDRAS